MSSDPEKEHPSRLKLKSEAVVHGHRTLFLWHTMPTPRYSHYTEASSYQIKWQSLLTEVVNGYVLKSIQNYED
jgi:hypothetical protein